MSVSYTQAALLACALLLTDAMLLIAVLALLRHYAEAIRGQIQQMYSSDLHRLSAGVSEANERLQALGVLSPPRTRKDDR